MLGKLLSVVVITAVSLSLAISEMRSSDATQLHLDLPQPHGCHSVGTRTVVLKDLRRTRDLLVTVWYPAAEGKYAFAAYMDKKTAAAVAEDWKLSPDFERHVQTHAKLQPPIAATNPFPVVFLKHGSGVVPAS